MYPGLPGFGYGLHLQPNDVLQFIKGTPAWKQVQQQQGLSDAQIARLAAETGYTGVQQARTQQQMEQERELQPLRREEISSEIGRRRAATGSEVLGQQKTRQEMELAPRELAAKERSSGAMANYYSGASDRELQQLIAQVLPHLKDTYKQVIGPDRKPTMVPVPNQLRARLEQYLQGKLGSPLPDEEMPGQPGAEQPPPNPEAAAALREAMGGAGAVTQPGAGPEPGVLNTLFGPTLNSMLQGAGRALPMAAGVTENLRERMGLVQQPAAKQPVATPSSIPQLPPEMLKALLEYSRNLR